MKKKGTDLAQIHYKKTLEIQDDFKGVDEARKILVQGY